MVMRGPRHAVFFSGDTGLTDQYATIRERLGPFDLALLEVGAWHPAWGDIHLGPDHAMQALALLGHPAFLPVHWGTFCLAMHDWDQPAERLLELAPSSPAALLMPGLGQALEPAHGPLLKPWWRQLSTDKSLSKRELCAQDAPASEPHLMPKEAWPLD
jgi:L-ascorbate metabolism protein UlaG (beta-lactamase superfamily)